MKAESKLFAFRLAEKRNRETRMNDGKWRARPGVSLAGCTPAAYGNYRSIYNPSGDTGVFC
ncbi:MAG: hypothetical protein ACRDFS_06355 [Chloroflexota bacterium]